MYVIPEHDSDSDDSEKKRKLELLPGGGLAPWLDNVLPGDEVKEHVEDIHAGLQDYTIMQGGTMDGVNCSSPLGCGMSKEGVLEQRWESNRTVRLENVGGTDVVNPWLSNGRGSFRNVQEIVAAATTEDMSDGEKAIALWWHEVRHRYHFNGQVDNEELSDVVKVFNAYGHNTCGNDSVCLASLWREAGLEVAPGHAVLHCISQASYDNAWHLFDGDMHTFYLLRDNTTVASEQDLMRDHDLIKRSHTQGILFPDDRSAEEVVAAMYLYEGPVTGTRGHSIRTSMDLTLRPGEALVWRWGHLTPPKCQGGSIPLYPDMVCNGLLEYRPDFSRATWLRGSDRVEGVQVTADGLKSEGGKTGTILWTMRSPYVFVGGRLQVEGTGMRFAVSFDGKSWLEVTDDLDILFAARGPGRYRYQLRCELSGDAHLKALVIRNDLQMAPLSLPGMRVGENRFVYNDESPGKRQVRITHSWVERSSSNPPRPPVAALVPTDNGESDGTDFVFQWTPSISPDGASIQDYHFELSARPDMSWPLSMSFAKLISRTADKGEARYTLPQAGLLTPGTHYFWRVRAQNAKGVWGSWSKTWCFVAGGPGVPLEVKVEPELEGGLVLHWQPNPQGRKAVKYRIYGSDEKGFSVSDDAYERVERVKVNRDVFDKTFSQVPANFVLETEHTSAPILSGASNSSLWAYYRVVAVDERGKRSGPSDYAEAPRPVIFSRPVTVATKGEPYRYTVMANRSLGDLRLNGEKTGGFWDVETFVFAVESGPEWLTMDAETGLLSGVPDTVGDAKVVVSVILKRTVRELDEETLKWGGLKIEDTRVEILGPDTQTFVLEVTP